MPIMPSITIDQNEMLFLALLLLGVVVSQDLSVFEYTALMNVLTAIGTLIVASLATKNFFFFFFLASCLCLW